MATKTLTLQPLGDRLVVKALPQEEKSAGGIFLPDTAKEKPNRGEVLAVGSGRITDDGKKVKPEVKVGDKVMYGKYSGTEVKIEGEEYVILQERDVLAILQ